MNAVVLSIVIPTYQRATCLKLLLASLTSELSDFPTDCEVIVLDNASADNTQEVVAQFSAEFPIQYVRKEKNIGMDGNIASCFDAASGKYLWVLGDDEILYRGTFDYVLNFCRTKDFGILHMENGGFNDGEENEVRLISIPDNLKITSLNSIRMFREANIFLTFISANIINRDAVINKFPEFSSRSDINTFLPQMAWMYSVLKAMDNHFLIRTPMFGALTGNTGGYKLIEVFGVNLINITKKYFSQSFPDAINIMSNAVVTRLVPGEVMRQTGKSSTKSKFEYEDINAVISLCFSKNIYFIIFLKPILSNSKFLRLFSFFSVRVFNRINKKFKYFML
jgi:glycosyltransferase involved in cell wall biosynthesis